MTEPFSLFVPDRVPTEAEENMTTWLSEHEILTITEAAVRLGVNTSTLRRRFEAGKHDARKSGGTWLVEWPMENPPRAKPRKIIEEG